VQGSRVRTRKTGVIFKKAEFSELKLRKKLSYLLPVLGDIPRSSASIRRPKADPQSQAAASFLQEKPGAQKWTSLHQVPATPPIEKDR
jgi:hypothetical protein